MQAIRNRCVRLWAAACLAVAGPLSPGARADEAPHAHEHEHDPHDPMETIFVSASPLTHETDEMAATIDEADRDELLRQAGASLGETLAGRPGISSSGFSAGASRPVIRGQDAFRTGVVEDGLGLGDVSTLSPDHGVPTNPLVAQRVEVVRGPSTVRYGGGAIAGVVNALTGRLPRELPLEPISGDVYGAYGFNADERILAFTLDGRLSDFAWHADGMSFDQNDYDVPGPGDQPGSDVDANAFSGGLAWVGERGRLGVAYSRFESEYGVPEVDEEVSIDMTSDRYRIEGDLNDPFPGLRELRTRWAVVDYRHDEIADDMVGQSFENLEVEGRLEALHEPLFGMVGAVGLHVRTRDEEFAGEAEEFLAPAERRMLAGYLFEEWRPFLHVDVQLGGRVESTQVEGTPFGAAREQTERFTPLSASLGVLFHPGEVFSIGVSGAFSQRAPASSELFARGPHEATSTFEIGDPSLGEETAWSGELVLRADAMRALRSELAFFVTRYDDYIVGQLTGVTVDEDGNPDPMGELDQLFYGARDAVFYGGEASLDWEAYDLPFGTFGVDAGFDWVRARFTRGADRDVPRIPPIRWGGGLFYRGDAWNARVGFLRYERQDRIARGETVTDDFTVLDVDLSYRITAFDGALGVEFFVDGRNLTDSRGRNHVSFTKDEVLMPGARVRFGLRGDF